MKLFLGFCVTLVFIRFCFRAIGLLLAILDLPKAAASALLEFTITWVSPTQYRARIRLWLDRASGLVDFLGLVLACVTFSAMTAILAVMARHHPLVTWHWPYVLFGFTFVFTTLSGNVAARKRDLYSDSPVSFELKERGLVASTWGLVLGMLLYPAFYIWPLPAAALPGFRKTVGWTLDATEWLHQFWITRVALRFAAGWLVIRTLFVLLTAIIFATSGFVAWRRARQRRSLESSLEGVRGSQGQE